MTNALILHGKPTRERYENPEIPKPHEANWLPWLGRELAKRGIESAIPRFPEPYAPDYSRWREEFELYPLNEDTTLVGHSAGAEFGLRYLSENRGLHIAKFILVAPYQDRQEKYGDFSVYDLDTRLDERIGSMSIFNSLDDDKGIRQRVAYLRAMFPRANYTQFDHHGHFRIGHNMETEEFPELLDEVLA